MSESKYFLSPLITDYLDFLKNIGEPPTLLNALTGELTPPAICFFDFSNNSCEFFVFIWIFLMISYIKGP